MWSDKTASAEAYKAGPENTCEKTSSILRLLCGCRHLPLPRVLTSGIAPVARSTPGPGDVQALAYFPGVHLTAKSGSTIYVNVNNINMERSA